MELLLLLILQIIIISQNALKINASDITPDCYWRNFVGRIPADAIAAGKDKAGNPIYIGQVLIHGHGVFPTTVYSNSKTVTITASGRDFTSDRNIKILCSQQPEKYQWISTHIDKMHLLTNCMFVTGGTEVEIRLYIGRAFHITELQIGKVFPHFAPYKGLEVPRGGRFHTFEVFAYNCSTKQDCKC